MNKPPLGLKQPREEKPARKPLPRVSKKRAAERASEAGRKAAQHLKAVKSMDCVACGKRGPSDAHHCRNQPPEGERHMYVRLPCAGRTSSDFDAIPLCRDCHRARHNSPAAWVAEHGPDYGFLPLVRAALNGPDEIDF